MVKKFKDSKIHRCGQCGCEIPIGEFVISYTLNEEGDQIGYLCAGACLPSED